MVNCRNAGEAYVSSNLLRVVHFEFRRIRFESFEDIIKKKLLVCREDIDWFAEKNFLKRDLILNRGLKIIFNLDNSF